MRIFQSPVKSMPIPGPSLKTLDLAFLSGYLGWDVTDKQQKLLIQGMAHRRWVDAIELTDALGGGYSRIDESTIPPASFEERYEFHCKTLSALDEIVDKAEQAGQKLSALQDMIAEKWLEGAVMGASLIGIYTAEDVANQAVKYARRHHP